MQYVTIAICIIEQECFINLFSLIPFVMFHSCLYIMKSTSLKTSDTQACIHKRRTLFQVLPARMPIQSTLTYPSYIYSKIHRLNRFSKVPKIHYPNRIYKVPRGLDKRGFTLAESYHDLLKHTLQLCVRQYGNFPDMFSNLVNSESLHWY